MQPTSNQAATLLPMQLSKHSLAEPVVTDGGGGLFASCVS